MTKEKLRDEAMKKLTYCISMIGHGYTGQGFDMPAIRRMGEQALTVLKQQKPGEDLIGKLDTFIRKQKKKNTDVF